MPRPSWPALAALLCAACFKDLGSDDDGSSVEPSTTDKSSTLATTTGTSSDETSTTTDIVPSTTGSSDGTGSSDATDSSDPTVTSDPTAPAACGDSVIEGDETCEDGNQLPGDGCSACALEFLHVFVTDALVDGALMGTAVADQVCASEAEKAGRRGRYIAWLSTADISPKTRFATGPYAFRLTDDVTVVASDFASLIMGPLQHPIDRLADATPVPPTDDNCNDLVWTGTVESGDPAPLHCDSFITNDITYTGAVGNYGDINKWSEACNASCNQLARLYCFEQLP